MIINLLSYSMASRSGGQMFSDDEFSISEVVLRLAGLKGLHRLREIAGGTNLYVPATIISPDHPLVLALGLDAANNVCSELYRTRHYVPKQDCEDRVGVIWWCALAGITRRATAGIAGCSEVYVYRIVARAREAGTLPRRRPAWEC